MAAGLGTRMRSAVPKHLHPLLGRRLVDWVLEAGRAAGAEPVVVVTSPERAGDFDGFPVAVQHVPRGTGDAVAAARASLADHDGDVLVLSGDAPLLTPDLLRDLVTTHRREACAATVLTAIPPDPRLYGRIVRDGGRVLRVIEGTDASPEELAIPEVNTSIYVFRADALWAAIDRLEPHNVQGELYLTDTIGHLVELGHDVAAHRAPDATATEGVNTRVELAAAAAVLRDRINECHMLAGATIVDPASTWIEADVELAPDCVVHPFTVLRGRTRIAEGAEIGPHAVAVDAEIGAGVVVGPFCYLRPGTVLEPGAKAGTFVEIKKSRVGEGAKVPHLSYIGDAEIGAGTNVGAGTITANFPHQPGRPKGKTTIGRNVRIGVDTMLMAPVSIGDDAWTAGGSVISEDVPPESLAGFPPRQVTKEGYLRGKRDD